MKTVRSCSNSNIKIYINQYSINKAWIVELLYKHVISLISLHAVINAITIAHVNILLEEVLFSRYYLYVASGQNFNN